MKLVYFTSTKYTCKLTNSDRKIFCLIIIENKRHRKSSAVFVKSLLVGKCKAASSEIYASFLLCRMYSTYFIYLYNVYSKKVFWEELISYFLLTRHEPHRERRVQFYCCVCILCRGNVFYRDVAKQRLGKHIQTYTLIGGISEIHHWNRLRWRDTHTKFHKDWFRH
jgi:hypothetical protein